MDKLSDVGGMLLYSGANLGGGNGPFVVMFDGEVRIEGVWVGKGGEGVDGEGLRLVRGLNCSLNKL